MEGLAVLAGSDKIKDKPCDSCKSQSTPDSKSIIIFNTNFGTSVIILLCLSISSTQNFNFKGLAENRKNDATSGRSGLSVVHCTLTTTSATQCQ